METEKVLKGYVCGAPRGKELGRRGGWVVLPLERRFCCNVGMGRDRAAWRPKSSETVTKELN